jgi:hypothetical protein
MNQMAILSSKFSVCLKTEKKYAHPADAPYLSVCTTSTHDMATIAVGGKKTGKPYRNFTTENWAIMAKHLSLPNPGYVNK